MLETGLKKNTSVSTKHRPLYICFYLLIRCVIPRTTSLVKPFKNNT